MKQGEIYWAQLNPVKGREQAGQRPVLIVSGNAMNEALDLVITCPLSTALKHYPGSVCLKKGKKNGLAADSEVITFQIRTVSKARLFKKIGTISATEFKQVIRALNEVLFY